MSFLILILLTLPLYGCVLPVTAVEADGCDFPEIRLDSFENFVEASEEFKAYKGRSPVLLRGFMSDWPSQSWSKQSFIDEHGDFSVTIGSEASIVLSHGKATRTVKIKDYLEFIHRSALETSGTPMSESFVFDTEVLPKMARNMSRIYKRPTALSSSEYEDLPDNSSVMHVLSIGGPLSGLSFHVHGEAWLGILSMLGPDVGKQWFVQPPGSPPASSDQESINPYIPVSEFVESVLKQRLQRSLLTAQADDHFDAVEEISVNGAVVSGVVRYCNQRPGDVVYIPDGWPHLTLNIGPVIGIGEQKVWLAADREEFCRYILETNPADYDCLKGLAIALLSMANEHNDDNHFVKEKRTEAILNLRSAVKARPLYPECRVLLVETLFGLNSPAALAEALVEASFGESVLDKLLGGNNVVFSNSSRRGLSMSYYRLASVLAKNNEVDMSIRLLEKAIAHDEENVMALGHLAFLYHEIGDSKALSSVLTKMEAITPGHRLIEKMKNAVPKKRGK